MVAGEPVLGSLYVYAPNGWAPIPFIVLFALSGLAYGWQHCKYRTFGLTGYQTLCTLFFTIGFALRQYGTTNYYYQPRANLVVFIMSQVFIYICPPLLELGNYHILGRAFSYVPHRAPIPPGRVMPLFGGILLAVEVLNALGVALAANPTGANVKIGGQLVIAAVIIQLVMITTFVILAGVFWKNCRGIVRIKPVLIALYCSMGLILVRSVYRLIEHLGNTKADYKDPGSLLNLTPLLRYEWFFYTFEAVPMLLNSFCWNIWNPSRYLPSNRYTHLAKDSVTHVEDPQSANTQFFIKRVANFLTFGLLFKPKDNQAAFSNIVLQSSR